MLTEGSAPLILLAVGGVLLCCIGVAAHRWSTGAGVSKEPQTSTLSPDAVRKERRRSSIVSIVMPSRDIVTAQPLPPPLAALRARTSSDLRYGRVENPGLQRVFV